MDWNHKLVKMNWKLKLLVVFGIGIIVTVLIKLPISQAQTDSKVDVKENQNPVTEGKITRYPNGVSKMEPTAFGITKAVRDLPTSDPDAAKKRKSFVSVEKRRELKRERILKEKGIEIDKDEDNDINEINNERVKTIIPGAGAGFDAFQDPLLEKRRNLDAPQAMPTPNLTFNGATSADNAAQGIGGLQPPDTNGDIGLNHYVSSVNLVYKIFNKNGTVAAGPFKTSDLFSGLPANDPCRVYNDGDPIAVYDSLADRWNISQFALKGYTTGSGPNYQCIAESVTGDPTGAYYVWSYPYPGGLFNDYPKVGVWSDAYHITFNQFNNAGNAFLGLGILSQDRAKALLGDPATSVVYTNVYNIDPSAGGALPADIDGIQPPPPGMAEVIGEFRADEFGNPLDAIRYYKWVPDFVNPGNSSISVLPDVALAAFDARSPTSSPIEQSGGSVLDGLNDRLMHFLKYRNLGTQAAPINAFTGNFTVNVSGVNPTTAATYQAGIRWFEMRRTNDTFSVFDQGTLSTGAISGATGLNDWMGSLALDNKGNLAIGFSQASTTQRANIMIAGRTGAPSGTLDQGEALFYAAPGSQTGTGNTRWGDYSSMNLDPTDDCTFWYTQEYYAANSTTSWSTRVGNFKFPSCTPPQKGTITGTITYCDGGAPVNQASVSATGGFNRLTIANGTYSITVAPGTYTVSATKLGGFNLASQGGVVVSNGGTATANICLTGVAVVSSGNSQITSESCGLPNNTPDPGERLTVSLPLSNTGAASTSNLTATLQATGGVTDPSPARNYGAIAPGGAAVSKEFSFTVDPNLICGTGITLTWVITDGATNYGTVTKTFQTGTVSTTANTYSYTTPSVAIPDNNATGVNVTLPVSGFTGRVGDLNFRLDALTGCNTTAGNTNASVTHTYLGDLSFKLTSPQGTTVNLITQRGGSGNNFCTVVLDDQGGYPAISTISATAGAIAGNYTPESPLSAFNGENPNGNWTLNVADSFATDTGTINRFSLVIAPKVCTSGCFQSKEADVAGRPNGDGLIQSNDVVQVTRFVNELDTPSVSPNEFQRADSAPRTSNGDGAINSADIVQTIRYLNEFDATQSANGPTTLNGNRGEVNDADNISSDGREISKADADQQSGKVSSPDVAPELRVESTTGSAGNQVSVNIRVDATGNEAQYAFAVLVDPNVLTFASFAAGETTSQTFSCNGTATAGRVRCSIGAFTGNQAGSNTNTIGEIAPGNNQILIKVNFTVAANAQSNSTTAVNLGSQSASDDSANSITPAITNGTVTIAGATAAGAAISGRVLTAAGRGVANALVNLTDQTGAERTARTNGFGYYRFTEVETGASYTLGVRAKGSRYETKAITVRQDLDDLDFIPVP